MIFKKLTLENFFALALKLFLVHGHYHNATILLEFQRFSVPSHDGDNDSRAIFIDHTS